MQARMHWFVPGIALLLGACATLPSGPSVMVMPGSSKSFEAFMADDDVCRGWAGRQTGAVPEESGDRRAVKGAVVGTAVGAAAGALIGAASYDAGPGALIGAGAGLLLGTGAGSARGELNAGELQHRYDMSYTQCMYAKGNRVPVPGGFAREDARASSPPNPRRAVRPRIPPPPRGAPPPPPPDAG
jgi:hypothetical protein